MFKVDREQKMGILSSYRNFTKLTKSLTRCCPHAKLSLMKGRLWIFDRGSFGSQTTVIFKNMLFAEQSQLLLCRSPKNKANSKPKQTQFDPKQSHFSRKNSEKIP